MSALPPDLAQVKLTRQMRFLLNRVAARGWVSGEALRASFLAEYPNRPRNQINVQMHKLRERLNSTGWTVSYTAACSPHGDYVLERTGRTTRQTPPDYFLDELREYLCGMRESIHRRILCTLVERATRWVDCEELLDVSYADREDGGPEGADDVLKVVVCRLRKKIAPLGAVIRTGHGQLMLTWREPWLATETSGRCCDSTSARGTG